MVEKPIPRCTWRLEGITISVLKKILQYLSDMARESATGFIVNSTGIQAIASEEQIVGRSRKFKFLIRLDGATAP